MACDYLPIQGSSTPSEHAFSNASLTDSKQRNWLAPDMFKALQILKSSYRYSKICDAQSVALSLKRKDYDCVS